MGENPHVRRHMQAHHGGGFGLQASLPPLSPARHRGHTATSKAHHGAILGFPQAKAPGPCRECPQARALSYAGTPASQGTRPWEQRTLMMSLGSSFSGPAIEAVGSARGRSTAARRAATCAWLGTVKATEPVAASTKATAMPRIDKVCGFRSSRDRLVAPGWFVELGRGGRKTWTAR